jgi:adenylate cyclase
MGMEIERKFLIKNKPANLPDYPHKEISQGYMVVEDQYEIRVRKKGDKYYQTVKIGIDFQREEIETQISRERFNKLWPLTINRRIEKTRYEIEFQNNVIELDVYKDDLENLLIAEVEFETIEKGRAFDPPEWFGPEVTENSQYNNKFLATNGLPKTESI